MCFKFCFNYFNNCFNILSSQNSQILCSHVRFSFDWIWPPMLVPPIHQIHALRPWMRVCGFVQKYAPGSVRATGGGTRGTETDASGALESRSCVRCVVSRITRADTSRTITIGRIGKETISIENL